MVQAKDAHVGVVKSYATPPAPKARAIPADLASELSAYDAFEPAAAAPEPVAKSSFSEDTVSGADAYLTFLEADLPKPEEHHH